MKVSEKEAAEEFQRLRAQKKVVVLVNEGTASAAEVFVSSLHDNGRTVAVVGTKTYGKGLIQHTFPMPDGGGLRLTVAEYLTPALQHVTNVGDAQYNAAGELVGGGIRPDIQCSSNQGIPSDIGADFCVGVALDALQNADMKEQTEVANADRSSSTGVGGRRGGADGGAGRRRPVIAGAVRDDY
jgi:hypothetical protein